MKIVEKAKIWFGISLAVMIIGLIMGLVQGLNFGIDFTGGTMMRIDLGKSISVSEIKKSYLHFN